MTPDGNAVDGAPTAPLPLVDVVTPTNRSGEFLQHAVSTVLAQTHQRWHHHVIDTGSPDPAAVQAAIDAAIDADGDPERARRRITVTRSAARGISAGRNAGIAQGRGAYLAFLDDDDAWEPDFLERLVGALEADPDATAAYSAGRYLDDDDETIGSWSAQPASRAELLSGAIPLPRIQALVVRRAVGERVGWFDERFPAAEDMDLICRFLIAGGMIADPRPLAFYRMHSSSISRRLSADRIIWIATETFLGEHTRRARRAGDGALAAQITANRKRARHHAAYGASHTIFRALTTGRLGEAALLTACGLRYAPLQFTVGSVRRIIAGLSRRLRRGTPS